MLPRSIGRPHLPSFADFLHVLGGNYLPGVGDDPATLSVISRGPFQQSDHQPPSIVLTNPGASLTTSQNVLVAGRVTDDLSGVASLQAQVDTRASST